ncbi:MAG: hypothetical protein J6L89_03720 [Clostridia bacterium]|nr:hypothetical protein [Clostridia bacterium]
MKKQTVKKQIVNKQSIFFIGKILLVVLAAVSIIFIAASSFSNVTFSNIKGTIDSFFLNAKKGDGYPYECSNLSPERTGVIGSYLALLDDSTVVFLNKTAKEVLKSDTTYTNPDMKISNGRALVYNRGGSSFIVTGQSDILYDNNETADVFKDGIITAAIGGNGNLGFATWTDEGTSKFIALNKKLSTEFYYVFGSDRAFYVALSDNGKYGACAVFGAENATYYSKLYIFDFSKTEPVKVVKYADETLIRVDFLDNKTLSVVTDVKRRIITIADKTEKNVVDFSMHNLESVDFDSASKRSALCYSKYGSTSNVICGFDKRGKETCRIEDVENVKQVKCNSKRIAVLTDEKILCYNYNGKLKNTIELSFNVDSIEFTSSSGLFVFSGSNVYKVKMAKNTVLEAE